MTAVSVDVLDLFGSVRGVDLAEVMHRAGLRNEHGYNYLEVSMSGESYPMLSIFFRDDHAVVAYIAGDEEPGTRMLNGDSSVGPDEVMEFLMLGNRQEFTGEVIVSAATAGEFLKTFAAQMPWPDKPSWMYLA